MESEAKEHYAVHPKTSPSLKENVVTSMDVLEEEKTKLMTYNQKASLERTNYSNLQKDLLVQATSSEFQLHSSLDTYDETFLPEVTIQTKNDAIEVSTSENVPETMSLEDKNGKIKLRNCQSSEHVIKAPILNQSSLSNTIMCSKVVNAKEEPTEKTLPQSNPDQIKCKLIDVESMVNAPMQATELMANFHTETSDSAETQAISKPCQIGKQETTIIHEEIPLASTQIYRKATKMKTSPLHTTTEQRKSTLSLNEVNTCENVLKEQLMNQTSDDKLTEKPHITTEVSTEIISTEPTQFMSPSSYQYCPEMQYQTVPTTKHELESLKDESINIFENVDVIHKNSDVCKQTAKKSRSSSIPRLQETTSIVDTTQQAKTFFEETVAAPYIPQSSVSQTESSCAEVITSSEDLKALQKEDTILESVNFTQLEGIASQQEEMKAFEKVLRLGKENPNQKNPAILLDPSSPVTGTGIMRIESVKHYRNQSDEVVTSSLKVHDQLLNPNESKAEVINLETKGSETFEDETISDIGTLPLEEHQASKLQQSLLVKQGSETMALEESSQLTNDNQRSKRKASSTRDSSIPRIETTSLIIDTAGHHERQSRQYLKPKTLIQDKLPYPVQTKSVVRNKEAHGTENYNVGEAGVFDENSTKAILTLTSRSREPSLSRQSALDIPLESVLTLLPHQQPQAKPSKTRDSSIPRTESETVQVEQTASGDIRHMKESRQPNVLDHESFFNAKKSSVEVQNLAKSKEEKINLDQSELFNQADHEKSMGSLSFDTEVLINISQSKDEEILVQQSTSLTQNPVSSVPIIQSSLSLVREEQGLGSSTSSLLQSHAESQLDTNYVSDTAETALTIESSHSLQGCEDQIKSITEESAQVKSEVPILGTSVQTIIPCQEACQNDLKVAPDLSEKPSVRFKNSQTTVSEVAAICDQTKSNSTESNAPMQASREAGNTKIHAIEENVSAIGIGKDIIATQLKKAKKDFLGLNAIEETQTQSEGPSKSLPGNILPFEGPVSQTQDGVSSIQCQELATNDSIQEAKQAMEKAAIATTSHSNVVDEYSTMQQQKVESLLEIVPKSIEKDNSTPVLLFNETIRSDSFCSTSTLTSNVPSANKAIKEKAQDAMLELVSGQPSSQEVTSEWTQLKYKKTKPKSKTTSNQTFNVEENRAMQQTDNTKHKWNNSLTKPDCSTASGMLIPPTEISNTATQPELCISIIDGQSAEMESGIRASQTIEAVDPVGMVDSVVYGKALRSKQKTQSVATVSCQETESLDLSMATNTCQSKTFQHTSPSQKELALSKYEETLENLISEQELVFIQGTKSCSSAEAKPAQNEDTPLNIQVQQNAPFERTKSIIKSSTQQQYSNIQAFPNYEKSVTHVDVLDSHSDHRKALENEASSSSQSEIILGHESLDLHQSYLLDTLKSKTHLTTDCQQSVLPSIESNITKASESVTTTNTYKKSETEHLNVNVADRQPQEQDSLKVEYNSLIQQVPLTSIPYSKFCLTSHQHFMHVQISH